MMTLAGSIPDVLDALLDHLQRRREHMLAAAPCAHRAIALAELYEREARVWSLLFERSRSRIQWRAALAAEAHARACARAWHAEAAARHRHARLPAPINGGLATRNGSRAGWSQ